MAWIRSLSACLSIGILFTTLSLPALPRAVTIYNESKYPLMAAVTNDPDNPNAVITSISIGKYSEGTMNLTTGLLSVLGLYSWQGKSHAEIENLLRHVGELYLVIRTAGTTVVKHLSYNGLMSLNSIEVRVTVSSKHGVQVKILD